MSEAFHRAAKAMYDSDPWFRHTDNGPAVVPWAEVTDDLRRQVEGYTRAVITSLRDPTDEQCEALSATGKPWRELNSRTVWQTYVDAILRSEPTL